MRDLFVWGFDYAIDVYELPFGLRKVGSVGECVEYLTGVSEP